MQKAEGVRSQESEAGSQEGGTRSLQSPASSLQPAVSSLLLAGPTAVGKSEAALLLAERLGGEIISVDSMQVYRGLDIGTGKPSPQDRARVPHHLIDVVDITEPFDAARFVSMARQAVADIRSRGRAPILCGGTGLYFKAFLEGLGEAPPADAALRAELAAAPLEELLRELAERDPATYARIDCKNARRVIRAVEVIRLTGRRFSEQRATWWPVASDGGAIKVGRAVLSPPRRVEDNAPYLDRCLVVGPMRGPEDLRRRIGARVEEMFRRGLVAETEQLLRRGLAQNKTALQALGYRQVAEHLRGARSLAETVELVKARTRQYAKRQMTWFRGQLALRWIEAGSGESAESIAERVARELEPRMHTD